MFLVRETIIIRPFQRNYRIVIAVILYTLYLIRLGWLRLGCPGSLMSLYGPTFHVTPVDLCIIFQCNLYIYPVSCLEEIKLFQIVSLYTVICTTTMSNDVICDIEHNYAVCHIINLSLCTGIFPARLKLAQVTPIPKGDDVTNAGNYRPISVLPIFSKIFEKFYINSYTHI